MINSSDSKKDGVRCNGVIKKGRRKGEECGALLLAKDSPDEPFTMHCPRPKSLCGKPHSILALLSKAMEREEISKEEILSVFEKIENTKEDEMGVAGENDPVTPKNGTKTDDKEKDIKELIEKVKNGTVFCERIKGGFNQYLIFDSNARKLYIFEYDQDACCLKTYDIRGLRFEGIASSNDLITPFLRDLRDVIIDQTSKKMKRNPRNKPQTVHSYVSYRERFQPYHDPRLGKGKESEDCKPGLNRVQEAIQVYLDLAAAIDKTESAAKTILEILPKPFQRSLQDSQRMLNNALQEVEQIIESFMRPIAYEQYVKLVNESGRSEFYQPTEETFRFYGFGYVPFDTGLEVASQDTIKFGVKLDTNEFFYFEYDLKTGKATQVNHWLDSY